MVALRERSKTLVEMAELARPWCRQLVVGDLERLRLKDSLPAGSSYQVIVAADVLEHLRDPAAMLLQLKELLAPDGQKLSKQNGATALDRRHGEISLSLA